MKDTAGRWANRAAHWFRWAFLALVTVWLFAWVFPRLYPLSTALGIAMIITWLAMTWHQSFGGLCVPCMTEVPADASASAQRWARVLRLWHFSKSVRGTLVWLLFILATAVLNATVFRDSSELTQRLVRLPEDLYLFALCWSDWQHHKLVPWCPQCKDWGEGGICECVPDPVNTEVMS